MDLNREENYKHRKLALVALSKALDDICPRFETEPEEIRQQLIKERINEFKVNEKELDAEWQRLEKEALRDVKKLKKNAQTITNKLEKTRKTKRIASKVKDLQHKKRKRLLYLQQKLSIEVKKLNQQLSNLNPSSKKHAQITRKLNNLQSSMKSKMEKSEKRYDIIIQNTLNSDNSKLVDARIKNSEEVWKKRAKRLEKQWRDKELIFENKSYDLDQIRLAIQGFVEETDRIKLLCEMAGVNLLVCYLSVRERLWMIGRNSLEINNLIEKIKATGDV